MQLIICLFDNRDLLDLTNYEEITVDFNFYSLSMEVNEDFWLQISSNGGSSYTTVASYARGVHFDNNIFYSVEVTIEDPFTANTRLRFRNDASVNNDRIFLNNIVITGCSNTPGSIDIFQLSEEEVEEIEEEIIPTQLIKDFYLFPNPAFDRVNLQFDLDKAADVKMMVTNLIGQIIHHQDLILDEGPQQVKREYFYY